MEKKFKSKGLEQIVELIGKIFEDKHTPKRLLKKRLFTVDFDFYTLTEEVTLAGGVYRSVTEDDWQGVMMTDTTGRPVHRAKIPTVETSYTIKKGISFGPELLKEILYCGSVDATVIELSYALSRDPQDRIELEKRLQKWHKRGFTYEMMLVGLSRAVDKRDAGKLYEMAGLKYKK